MELRRWLNWQRPNAYAHLRQAGQLHGEAYSATILDGAGRVRATASNLPDNTPHYAGQYSAYDVMGRAVMRSNPVEINSDWTATGADATAQGGFGWVFVTQTTTGRRGHCASRTLTALTNFFTEMPRNCDF